MLHICHELDDISSMTAVNCRTLAMKQESAVEYFWRAWWWSSETRDRRGLDALVRCGMKNYKLAMSALLSTEIGDQS